MGDGERPSPRRHTIAHTSDAKPTSTAAIMRVMTSVAAVVRGGDVMVAASGAAEKVVWEAVGTAREMMMPIWMLNLPKRLWKPPRAPP